MSVQNRFMTLFSIIRLHFGSKVGRCKLNIMEYMHRGKVMVQNASENFEGEKGYVYKAFNDEGVTGLKEAV